jgi:hypothetical protein
MIAVHSSAVDALRRQEVERKAREDRMRNALEILAQLDRTATPELRQVSQYVRLTAREGLGRDEPTETEG